MFWAFFCSTRRPQETPGTLTETAFFDAPAIPKRVFFFFFVPLVGQLCVFDFSVVFSKVRGMELRADWRSRDHGELLSREELAGLEARNKAERRHDA